MGEMVVAEACAGFYPHISEYRVNVLQTERLRPAPTVNFSFQNQASVFGSGHLEEPLDRDQPLGAELWGGHLSTS